MVRPTGVMLELERFRKSPGPVMARDRKPKKMKGQGRDEEGPEMREVPPQNFDGGSEPYR
ncbi:uncharacterized protein Bfra_000039 [Botrytis fragariae]|uniref:Uncharacterized protein n=1 Tax=Botrytis fragariae TaxID=1964551 RepID=A0A8H6EMN8_9HELO|nr:uncharacterized protein Bfra_000039 [Botrytis fragariae]KAF5877877.1 hypothetical protein Bfra_000039 [Botrytis fragariae]